MNGPRTPLLGTESGSSVVETLIVLLLVGSGLTVGAVTLVIGFARVWLSHCTYEAAICLAEKQSRSVCESKLKSQVSQVVPSGVFRTTHLRETPYAFEARAEFEPLPGLTPSLLKHFGRLHGITVKSEIEIARTTRGLIR